MIFITQEDHLTAGAWARQANFDKLIADVYLSHLFFFFRYESHLGKVVNFSGEKTTENLKPQLESKLLLSTIRVALGEKIYQ